ncbi:ribbon-helix-helix protein, CopG family [Geomonas sp.]|uniref:ribbon-helix-helix protein, CopG family n=1 Tax=Geomonas sp. TaxID=2651584 RepID=UPI002B47B33D|nr:ribbon-helix-helix protein, CopG family [Geomonas sp.]HJV35284.1 ribbon-helix-helix protein, CopG family [Geomonas sp.]
MPAKKDNARHYVISLRVNDEEKTILDELTRRSRQSISSLMREAMQHYAPDLQKVSCNRP